MARMKLQPEIVTDAHGYTREDVPWELDEVRSVYGRLFHYLTGGGMRTFGRTIRQQKAARQHLRFWTLSAVLAALWLFFYFI